VSSVLVTIQRGLLVISYRAVRHLSNAYTGNDGKQRIPPT
jgi:hypothetical protein